MELNEDIIKMITTETLLKDLSAIMFQLCF